MKIVSLLILIVLINSSLVAATVEWSGRLKQGYENQQQFFDPTVVMPWTSDAVTSATPTDSMEGPVTEITTTLDFDFPIGYFTLGLYMRIPWYIDSFSSKVNDFVCNFVLPIIKFDDDQHSVTVGRLNATLFGNGLLVSAFPGSGVNYTYQWSNKSTNLFYMWQFERSDFQKEWLTFGGLSQVWDLGPGELGLLYYYDQSGDFEDKSRGQLSKGSAISTQFSWSWSKNWKLHSELAFNQVVALLAGLDTPLVGNVSMQARLRFMDQGYNPVLGRYSREGEKQTYANIRFPISLFAKKVTFRPQWGVKHTNDQDYWVPGIKLEFDLFDRLSFVGQLVSEQPMGKWGAKEHFEYTQAKVIWVIRHDLILSGEWRKTYNGFLNWKEIQSRVDLELQW